MEKVEGKMKTKEEILESKGFKITCHQEDKDKINGIFILPLLEAMEEYAKEVTQKKDELIKAQRELIAEIDKHEGTNFIEVQLRMKIEQLEKEIGK